MHDEVIEGDYEGNYIITDTSFFGNLKGFEIHRVLFCKNIPLNEETIENWEIVSKNENKSLGNLVKRGLIGGFLFGGLGLVAAAVTAKSEGVYVIINFKNGKRSLVQLSDETFSKFRFKLGKLEVNQQTKDNQNLTQNLKEE